jgi:hypothetical protein
MSAPHHIPFITEHYTVRHVWRSEYAVKCGGKVIARFDRFEHAADRAYQLNRARLL